MSHVRTCGYAKRYAKSGRKETLPAKATSRDGPSVGVLSLKQMRMWGWARTRRLLLNQSLERKQDVKALQVWARPTCVLTTGLAVAQGAAAASSTSSATVKSRVTLLWVTCSTKGNTCRPAGHYHMLSSARTLHETLNATRLSPASWRPMKTLASARYIFWKYNLPSWSQRTPKISSQDDSNMVTDFLLEV